VSGVEHLFLYVIVNQRDKCQVPVGMVEKRRMPPVLFRLDWIGVFRKQCKKLHTDDHGGIYD
jgi:hypothetical protein